MLGLLLITVSLLGYCLFIRQRFGLQAEETPILAVAAVGLALYFFALFNLLAAAAYGLLAAGLVLLLWVLLENRKSLRKLAEATLSPGMVAFIAVIPVLYLLFHWHSLSSWDEFSHWGFAAKAMTISNALPGRNTILTYPAYPPGTALFQYYLCKIIGWSEGVVAIAQLLIVWAAGIAFTKSIKWKQLPILILVLAVVCVGYIHFNNMIYRIQVDGLLGIVIGSAFALYYRTKDRSPRDIYKTIPVLAFAAIIKETGLVLAILLCLVILSDQFSLRAKLGDEQKRQGFFHRHANVSAILVLLGTSIATYASWKIYLNLVGITVNYNAVHDVFVAQYHAIPNPGIASAFIHALLNTNVGISAGIAEHFSTALFFWIFIALGTGLLLFAVRDRAARKRIAVITASLLCAFVIYALGLLFTYTYMFSAHEASDLASYYRYMGIIFQIIFLCLLAVCLDRMLDSQTERREKKWVSALPAALLLLYLAVTPPGRYAAFWRADNPPQARNAAMTVQSKLDRVAKPSDRVYLIFEHQDAGDFFIFKYELFPRGTNARNWDIGQTADGSDIWMEKMTPDQWAGELASYQYAYIGHAEDAFKVQYGSLFEGGSVQDGTLYAVDAAPGGSILLKPIG